MKFNRLFYVSVIILAIFIMGAVSAQDNETSDSLTASDGLKPEIELGSDTSEAIESDLNIIDKSNFKELNKLIDESGNDSEIRLVNDYLYNPNNDSKLKYGILIDKTLTIDGQGHSIDGKNNTVFIIKGNDVLIKNIVFKNTNIISDSFNCCIDNCSFVKCYKWEYGGAIHSNGANFSVSGCSFVKCSSNEHGGAIYSEGNNFKITNSSFVNCESYDTYDYPRDDVNYGGAIYSKGDNSRVIDCEFINCSAILGDAIYFDDEFTLANSSFVHGAWYGRKAGNTSNVSVDGVDYDISVFHDLKDNDEIILTKDYLILSLISIDANNVIIDASGNYIICKRIFSITGENVTIKNCNYINCSQGAISISGPKCNVVNCSFTDSLIDCRLGGSVTINAPDCSVVGCSFINCKSYGDNFEHFDPTVGGSVCVDSSNCRIVNCSFADARDCGAIHSTGANCSVINCSLRNLNTLRGGAILSEGDNFSAINCSFANCWADSGGAILSNGEDCFIIACKFFNCTAYEGGAISSWKGKIGILDCSFIYCLDKSGKVYYFESDYSIVNCSYINYPIMASDIKMYYNDGSYFSVKLYDSEGNAIGGVNVDFKLEGEKLKTVKTDAEGEAKVKMTKLPGNYKISAAALGLTVTKKITVKKVLSLKKVKKSAKELTLTATLKKGKTPMKGEKITFKLNGKKYAAKTNRNGVAKVAIKKKTLEKLKTGQKNNLLGNICKMHC